jgi:hypothetical protein
VLDVCSDADLPSALAFDHHEGSVTVKTGFELFVASPPCTAAILGKAGNNNDCPANSPDATNYTEVAWDKRGEWVLTYDAADSTGNEAESVKFAMAIMDITAPTITNRFTNVTWFYGEPTHYPGDATTALFDDNYDEVVDVYRLTKETYGRCTPYTENATGTEIRTHADKYRVCDYAGIFGDNYQDNCETFTRYMNVKTRIATQVTSTIKTSVLIDGVTGEPATSDTLECQAGQLGTGPFLVHETDDDVDVTADSCHCHNLQRPNGHCNRMLSALKGKSLVHAECAVENPNGGCTGDSGTWGPVLGRRITVDTAADCRDACEAYGPNAQGQRCMAWSFRADRKFCFRLGHAATTKAVIKEARNQPSKNFKNWESGMCHPAPEAKQTKTSFNPSTSDIRLAACKGGIHHGRTCGECTWHLDQISYPSDLNTGLQVAIRANVPGEHNHLVSGATRVFTVVDTTPPVIVMNWTAAREQDMHKSYVGATVDGKSPSFEENTKKCEGAIPGKAIHWAEAAATAHAKGLGWGPYLNKPLNEGEVSREECIQACEDNEDCAAWSYRLSHPKHKYYKRCYLLGPEYLKYAPCATENKNHNGACDDWRMAMSSGVCKQPGQNFYHYAGGACVDRKGRPSTECVGDNKHGGMDMDSDARRHASEGGLNTNLDLTNNMLVQHSAGYTLDAQQLDGIHRFHYCVDACDEGEVQDGGELVTRGSWHQLADEEAGCGSYRHAAGATNITDSENLDILEAGTFVFKYTCKDSSNNWATPKCTTVIHQDHSKPIVNAIEGINSICADLQLEGTCYYASATAPPYDDAGAICSDMVDGDISELVTVSGDVVDLAKVDTYHITYDCVDTTGNDAEQAFRDVFVVDRTCPTCSIPRDDEGKPKHYLVEEASFPYYDDPVFCTDDMPFTLHGEDFTNNGPCVYSKANPKAVTNAPCTAIAGSSDEKNFIPSTPPSLAPSSTLSASALTTSPTPPLTLPATLTSTTCTLHQAASPVATARRNRSVPLWSRILSSRSSPSKRASWRRLTTA